MGSAGYEPTGRRISSSSNPQRVIESSVARGPQFDMGDSVESSSGFGSGLIAFVQSVLFGLALVIVPILVTAVSSTTLIDQDFNFGASFATAAGVWALAHGASLTISGSLITIVPLGITLVLLVCAYVSVRRSLMFETKAVAAYISCYGLFGIVLAMSTGSSLGISVRAVLTTLSIAVISVVLAKRKRPDSVPFFARLRKRCAWLPQWVGVSGIGSLVACAFLTACAGLTTLAWIYLGKDAMFTVLQGWSLDALSGFALGVAQLAFLPNLMLWALSWLTGAGFVIGEGTLVSPSEVTLGPLPNLPLLGAIPQSEAPSSFGYVVLALVAAGGVVMAVRLSQLDHGFSWWMFLAVPALSVLGAVGFLGLVLWLSGGHIGAGANVWFGVPVWACVWRVALLLLVPSLITLALLRPELRSWLARARAGRGHVYEEFSDDATVRPLEGVAVPPVAAKSSSSAYSSQRTSPSRVKEASTHTSSVTQPSSSVRTSASGSAATSRSGVSSQSMHSSQSVRSTKSTKSAPSSAASPVVTRAQSALKNESSLTGPSVTSATSPEGD